MFRIPSRPDGWLHGEALLSSIQTLCLILCWVWPPRPQFLTATGTDGAHGLPNGLLGCAHGADVVGFGAQGWKPFCCLLCELDILRAAFPKALDARLVSMQGL